MFALDCNQVLHSTSQMYSHKRKHERQDAISRATNSNNQKTWKIKLYQPEVQKFADSGYTMNDEKVSI